MKKAESGLTTVELARTVNEKVSTISFWAQQGLLQFHRQNGRKRVFPGPENIARVHYIRQRQSSPVKLAELRSEIGRGRHLPRSGARG